MTNSITTTAVQKTEPVITTTTETKPIEPTWIKGDANGDGILNVRDAANIASALASGFGKLLSERADFNCDGKINVRDAAAIALYLSKQHL